MDTFLQSFDEFITHSHSHSHSHNSEASSSSETSSSNNRQSTAHYCDEEEVMLASARPKKRAGRRIFKETRHPVYRGVRRRNNNRWVCEVRVPKNKSRIWLGTYPTPEMAARAHDVAALTLRGKSACLNFADSAWRLPLPASTKAEEIRRVAAEAAEAFAVEDNCEQQSSKANITDNYEVCSSSTTNVGLGVMEDDANSNKEEGMCLDEVPTASAFDEDLHDWLVSMANEPLLSPPPFVRDGGFSWNEVEFDAEVSLWSFTI